jgi:hypothetical protein
MPFGSLQWLCVNRWPNEEREPMQEAWLCGSVFRRDPCLIEDGGSGRKPLLQKPFFVFL